MSSVKRRINSTGRKRIERKCIEINMMECLPGEPLSASVTLSLQEQGFPGRASVVIEAYRRSSGMRFDCGTVDAPSVSDPLVLREIDRSGSVLFRLKVIDNNLEPGKLLGSAERLRPRDGEDSEDRRSIFPVLNRDLEEDVWKVEIEQGDGPKLILNTRVPNFSYEVRNNPVTQGILLPAALRFVFEELVRPSDTGESEDEPDWKERWLRYCDVELGIKDDPRNSLGDEAKKNWIDDATEKFCEKYKFVGRMKASSENIQ